MRLMPLLAIYIAIGASVGAEKRAQMDYFCPQSREHRATHSGFPLYLLLWPVLVPGLYAPAECGN